MFSVGLRVQVYKRKAAQDYLDYPEYINSDKHPCSYIFDNPEKYKLSFLKAQGNWKFANSPDINFAVNYPKNFEFAQKVFRHYSSNPTFTLNDLFEFIKLYPDTLSLLRSK